MMPPPAAPRLALAAGVPAVALGAGGIVAAQRVWRLIEQPRPPGRVWRTAKSAALVLAVPALALSIPATAVAALAGCSAPTRRSPTSRSPGMRARRHRCN